MTDSRGGGACTALEWQAERGFTRCPTPGWCKHPGEGEVVGSAAFPHPRAVQAPRGGRGRRECGVSPPQGGASTPSPHPPQPPPLLVTSSSSVGSRDAPPQGGASTPSPPPPQPPPLLTRSPPKSP